MTNLMPQDPRSVTVNHGEFPPHPGDGWSHQNAVYLDVGAYTLVYVPSISRDGSRKRIIVYGVQKTPETLFSGGVKKVGVSRITNPGLKKQIEEALDHLGDLEFA
jgi:hypothetical protein